MRIEPGIEMPGYGHCVALRRPNALCPVRPPQTAIGRCLRTATNWDFAGECARPGGRFRRRARTGFTRHLTPALSPNSRWRRGRNARRLFEIRATGLAEPSSAKPESSNGHFLSPGERIKGEGERQHKLSHGFFRRSSTPNCHWPVLAHGHQLGLCRGVRPSRWPFSASPPLPLISARPMITPRRKGTETQRSWPTASLCRRPPFPAPWCLCGFALNSVAMAALVK